MNSALGIAKRVSGIACVAALLMASGCEQRARAPMALNAEMGGVAAMQVARREGRTLAYEHTVTIELDGEVLAARVDAVRSACAADEQHGCTILNVSTSVRGQVPEGTISMRLAPGGVDALIALASDAGEVLQRTSHAEDLAQPLADTKRQLDLLTLHRERLTELMQRKDIGVEQLITISRELAGVQTQLEELARTDATLRRRIDTDLLTLRFQVPNAEIYDHRTTIGEALRTFGANFRDAIAAVITFVAYLVPWLVIILPGLFFLRWFWSALGRWMKRRESRPAT